MDELEETSLHHRTPASRHHHHRRRAKKPPPTTNYNDVFGGPPKHAVPFSGVPDDYVEVFGGVSVSCSIPFLDLPTGQMDGWDCAGGESVNGVEYGEIFGRCDFSDFAVPYEELFGRGKNGEGEMDRHFASANGRSSVKGRSGPQTIEPLAFIQEYSNEDNISYLEDANFSVASEEIPKEYNTSYNKSSRTRAKELLHTTASVPHPQTGFTFVIEPNKPLPEHLLVVDENTVTHESSVKLNHKSSVNSQSISSKEPVPPGVPFLDVADVNLLTRSANMPPPAQPPPPITSINERQRINTFPKTDSVSNISTEAGQPPLPQQEKPKPFLKSDSLPPNFDFVPNLKLDKREKPKLKSRPNTFSKSESLPPGFGSELDAMKEAMEFAQARLKTAKELHEKRREGKITELPLKKKHVKEENLEGSEGEKPRVLRSISLASNFSKSREFMKVQGGVVATQGARELEKSGKWRSDEEFHELTSIEPRKERENNVGITGTVPLVETNREFVQINGLPSTAVGLTGNLNADVNDTENLELAGEIKDGEDLKREEKTTIGTLDILTGSREPVIELEKETGEDDTEASTEDANGISKVEDIENTGELEAETDSKGYTMKVGVETEEEERKRLDEETKRQRERDELEKERQREREIVEEEKERAHKLEEEKERALQLEKDEERAHKLEEEKERKLQMEREEKERREQERIMVEEEILERERMKKWEEESGRESFEKEREVKQRTLAEERERERKLEEERQEEKMREKEMVRKLEEEKERERKLEEEIEKERERVRKLEEEREQERERVRKLEEEKQREREMARKLEKDKERERKLEEEIEKERRRIRKLEEEREWEREKVRKLEEEREIERERVRKLEEEREQERERVRKLEEEREKERIEKERERKEREKIEQERDQKHMERIVKEREQKEMEKKLEEEREKQRMEKEKEEREKLRRMEKEREEKEMAMRLEAEMRRLEREKAEEKDKTTRLQGEKVKERKTEVRKSDEERERDRRMKEKERKTEGRKSDEERERDRRMKEKERKTEGRKSDEDREKAWERKSDEEGERERDRRGRKERESEEREREREDEERKREREKDRLAMERATQERAERIAIERITAARQRAVENREKEEMNNRGGGEGFEKKRSKGEEEKKEREGQRNAREARLRAERAAVERATVEARERAIEKAKAEAEKERDRLESFKSFNKISYQDHAQEARFKRTQSDSALSQGHGESALRHKARLERQQRTAERAAKALAEKNRRDIMAQREQAERDRIAEHLDADVKRWSSGKEGNLRALLSTLQYILGQNSGWQPIHLTEVITAADVKKAYRKATLYVHPDKLQQRGASIQQKYICEKVFDLLKEAWNKFNSEER